MWSGESSEDVNGACMTAKYRKKVHFVNPLAQHRLAGKRPKWQLRQGQWRTLAVLLALVRAMVFAEKATDMIRAAYLL